jgi:hypothetical protein
MFRQMKKLIDFFFAPLGAGVNKEKSMGLVYFAPVKEGVKKLIFEGV